MRVKDIHTDRHTHTRNDYSMPPRLHPPRHHYAIGPSNLNHNQAQAFMVMSREEAHGSQVM